MEIKIGQVVRLKSELHREFLVIKDQQKTISKNEIINLLSFHNVENIVSLLKNYETNKPYDYLITPIKAAPYPKTSTYIEILHIKKEEIKYD